MARFSFQMLVTGAVISIISVTGLSAAPLIASPFIVNPRSAAAPFVQVDYHRHTNNRLPHRVSACTTRQAESKARRMGIRNAKAIEILNFIRVSGWKRGKRVAVVFARDRGCPIIT